jgi:hypothetical protein
MLFYIAIASVFWSEFSSLICLNICNPAKFSFSFHSCPLILTKLLVREWHSIASIAAARMMSGHSLLHSSAALEVGFILQFMNIISAPTLKWDGSSKVWRGEEIIGFLLFSRLQHHVFPLPSWAINIFLAAFLLLITIQRETKQEYLKEAITTLVFPFTKLVQWDLISNWVGISVTGLQWFWAQEFH